MPFGLVVDGDSLRCGNLRLRLLGNDAPELRGQPIRMIPVSPGDGLG